MAWPEPGSTLPLDGDSWRAPDQRGTTTTPPCYSTTCQRCKQDSESPEHVFRTCSFARQVWGSTLPEAAASADSREFNDWFMHFLSNTESQVRFGFTIWFLWRSRNDYIFAGIEEAPNKLSQRILAWEVVAQVSRAAEQAISLGRLGVVSRRGCWVETSPDRMAHSELRWLAPAGIGVYCCRRCA
ncbi:unnamed protein product [Linum trigynum]|uniref:Reverse transcriptase zinc-binding domain-containing protein n=1 Tax=Linum trigynum TaxID=586398 RepID=A0AAV2F4K9_9ROSI